MSNSSNIDMTQSIWIEPLATAPDANGPADVPYDANNARHIETIGPFEVVEQAARNNADKIAVDDGDVRLTYAQFLDRVYGLAWHLIEATDNDSVVASVLPNSVASAIVIMACALSGRVLVPIDATHPPERQQAIFAESGAGLILLAKDAGIDISFIPEGIPRLIVDPAAATGKTKPLHHHDPDAPLFVSFTSGSTGRPKGVVSGCRYGAKALRHYIDAFHVNSSDVVLGLASLSTGGSRDTFAALSTGAKIRIFPMRSAAGLADLLRVLEEDKITILSFVPTALRALLSIPGTEKAFRFLRILDLHGERILASDIALFRSKLPSGCHISVTLGSIEAGAMFSWFVRDDQVSGAVVPVGYLLPGRRAALLDNQGRPVADGEVGELFARGVMAMGAWQNGRKAPGPFLPDPEDPASSIYPMRDLVRRRPDGLFEYVGRNDRKVKVRGLWADLGEVEAALRMIDGVADVVVVSYGGNSEDDRLAAFIVMAEGVAPPPASDVRRAVAKETADHMAPAEMHVLDSIPRLANFKPDLVRLKAMSA